MSASEGTNEHYISGTEEKVKNLQDSLSRLMNAISEKEKKERPKFIKDSIHKANVLIEWLSPPLRTKWLVNLKNVLTANEELSQAYGKSQQPSLDILNAVIIYNENAKNHNWLKIPESSHLLSFDTMFNDFRKESGGVDEWFAKLIEHMESLMNNPDVENRHVVDLLAKLTDLLKENSKGSYSSLRAALIFAKNFFMSLVKAYLSSIGAVGVVVSSILEAFESVNKSMGDAEEKMKTTAFMRMQDNFNTPWFEKHKAIFYDGSGTLLTHQPEPTLDHKA